MRRDWVGQKERNRIALLGIKSQEEARSESLRLSGYSKPRGLGKKDFRGRCGAEKNIARRKKEIRKEPEKSISGG